MARTPLEPTVERRSLGTLRLWSDDLARIVDIVRDNSTSMVIECDGYAIDGVEDLDDWDDLRVWDFFVNTADGRIEVYLDEDEAIVEVREAGYDDKGMIAEIEAVAAFCRRGFLKRDPTAKVLAFSLTLGALGVATMVVNRIVTGNWHAFGGGPWWISLAFVPITMLATWAVVREPRPGAVMYSRTREEAPLWLTRNRDALTTNAVVSFVFLVLGIGIGYLLPT
jgi:hypothetical protein